jgi:uncharacterized RDD family membrane protein YckC
MDRKYLLNAGPKRARLARIIAKMVDVGGVLALTLVAYPWGLIIGVVYLAVADSLFEGQSLGKKFIGFRVVSLEDGSPCSLKQSFIRNLPLLIPMSFAIVPFWGWIICALLSFPLVLLELYFLFKLGSSHRMGDVMADTTVVGNDPQAIHNLKPRQSWFEKPVPM